MDSDIARCRQLLRFAAQHEEHRRALELATGENFNLFRILGIGHLEVKTHSPIIGELLNPRGSHGQGGVYLSLFFEEMGITEIDPENCRLRLEHYIGPVTDDSGGRIDLFIQDESSPSRAVIIENKIFAGDQPDQMRRYRKKYPNAELLYLTLTKALPSGISDEDQSLLRFQAISYRDEIFRWLERCKKESASLPAVREMIGQYLHLIAGLTGRSVSKVMNNKLVEEALQNLDAYYALLDSQWEVRDAILKELDSKLDSLAGEFGLTRDTRIDEKLSRKDGEFDFIHPRLAQRNMKITFAFGKSDYRDFCFGFSWRHNGPTMTGVEEIRAIFTERFGCETPNAAWPAWVYFEEPYRNWSGEALKGIHSGDFVTKLREKLEVMIKMVDRLDAA